LYLWSFAIFYSPGFVIFSLAFFVTGVLIAILKGTGAIKTIELSFIKNPKSGFFTTLLIVFIMMGTVAGSYLIVKKLQAAIYYTNGVKTWNVDGDIDKAEVLLSKAAMTDSQDKYYRELAEVRVVKIQQLLARQDISPDILRMQFQEMLGRAIQASQQAIDLNKLDPLNWLKLGKIYELISPLKISGAGDFAIANYNEALKRSPFDPTPIVASARVKFLEGDTDEASRYLQSALDLKQDFDAALLLWAQIEQSQGNLDGAIEKVEQLVMLTPNNPSSFYQLGFLHYQNGDYSKARLVFERAVGLNADYSNARYFLGLIYKRQGLRAEAIEQFEKIEQLNPGNTEVKTILKDLRYGEEDSEDKNKDKDEDEEE
jgi:tetratricopeptide (TPR) repeat protein